MELSRTQFPNGGWQFHDPRTNFTAPFPKSDTFDRTVQRIIENRQKNGALVVRHKLAMDPVSVGKELELYTRRRLGIPDPKPPVAPPMILPGLSASVVGGVGGIKKLASGSVLLLSFEKSGQSPVAAETAEARAATCAGCPLNNKAKYEEWRELSVTKRLIDQTPRLQSLKLSFANATAAGLCDALFAPCAQLAHIPSEFLESKVRGEYKLELASNCWMKPKK